VLATSRAPLRIRGERVHPVSPLAVPDPARVPEVETVVASAAAQLFLERAREANPAFLLTRHNAAVVAAICWRLDGLPLALELAAARTRFLGATELLTHLDEALKSVGARDLPERQRTLRATLDWSHDLLSASEQAVFRRLSVFTGGFTLPAAEAVGATTDVLDVMGSLVDQSLVTVTTSPDGDRLRYALLEPVRGYALESWPRAVRRTRSGPVTPGSSRRSPSARDRSCDGRGRRRGWRSSPPSTTTSVRPSGCSWSVRSRSGWRRSAGRSTASGRCAGTRPRAEPGWSAPWPTRTPCPGVRGRGRSTWPGCSRSYAESWSVQEPSHETARQRLALRVTRGARERADGDRAGGAEQGDLVAGEGLLSEALAMSRELHDASVTALTLGGLARIALGNADPVRAAELLGEAEEVSRAAGDWFTLAATLSSQALAARLRGDDPLAGALLRESIQHAAELRNAWHLVLSISGLAGVAARQGLPHRAARLLGAVEGLSARMGVDVPWSTWQDLDRFDLQRVSDQLGAQAFDQERARGRAMPLEDAVAEALTDD
jgi:hypothetical protein